MNNNLFLFQHSHYWALYTYKEKGLELGEIDNELVWIDIIIDYGCYFITKWFIIISISLFFF